MNASVLPLRPLLARLNWYWICQLAGWGLVALFQTVLYSGNRGLAAVVLWTFVSALFISDRWHRFIKRRGWAERGVDWRLLAGSAFLLGPAMVVSVASAIHVVMRPIDNFGWLPVALLSWGGNFVVWNLAYVMTLSLRRANRLEAETLRLELHAKDSELRALQAQVNPHFFFNSLNSVRALIYEEPDSAAHMIDQLAGLMRYALQSGHVDTVALATELEAVHSYLAIEKIRFEERLRVRVDIEPGLEHVMVPPMSLQTLVENAVKYGVEQSTAGSDILVRAWRTNGGTMIEIANAGTIRLPGRSTQVGLANARKRLELAVAGASLQLDERDGWVRATLHLPAARVMPAPMRILIVDDERLARAELRRLLAARRDIEVVGEATNAEQAVAQVAALRPDVMLLDVQMPGASGFDLLQALDAPPEVIFTTAFDQYALRAFEVNALDYLQKPIQATRLAAALQRAAHRLALPTPGMPAVPPKKMFVRDGDRCWFVALERIRLFESEGNYTRMYFDDERPLMLRSLTQLEERLDPERFLRASRRHIVNLAFVERMTANDAGGLDLLLPGGLTVEVSRRRAAQVRSLGA